MKIDKKIYRSSTLDWGIPSWFKIVVTLFPIGFGSALIRALMVQQSLLLGLNREIIIILAITLFAVSGLFATCFWLCPNGVLSRTLYWLTCLFRWHICVLSLLGVLYLVTIRAPFISLRGGILYLLLLLMIGVSLFVRRAGADDMPHPSLKPAFDLFDKLVLKVETGSTVIWSLIASVTPGGIVLLVIYVLFGAKLSNYGPYSFWNDEVGYWVWLRSFSYVGFTSGYNVPNETLPVFEFSRYGEASPFYLYVYGTIAHLVGWFPVLPILMNLFFISLSIFLFVRLTRLDVRQIIFVILAVVTSWPVLLYLPMTTHESLNQAFGIVFAVAFINLLAFRHQTSVVSKWLFLLLLYFATFVRLSWGLLLIPALFYVLNGSILKRGMLSILIGGGLYLFAIVLMGYFLPPLNNSIFDTFKGGVGVLNKLREQIYYMFVFKEFTPNIGVIFQMFIVIGWGVIRLFKLLLAGVSLKSVLDDFDVFDVYNVASLLLAGFVFYLQEGFYRTFAPAMLIVYLLLVFRRDFRRLSVLLMINLIFFSSYMNFYGRVGDLQIVRADYTRGFADAPQIQADVEKFIVYDPDTSNPWCNTLLIPRDFYDARLVLIPPGIGISYILEPSTFELPIKSRYILFDADTYETYKDLIDFRYLTSLSIGDLYINMGTDCSNSR